MIFDKKNDPPAFECCSSLPGWFKKPNKKTKTITIVMMVIDCLPEGRTATIWKTPARTRPPPTGASWRRSAGARPLAATAGSSRLVVHTLTHTHKRWTLCRSPRYPSLRIQGDPGKPGTTQYNPCKGPCYAKLFHSRDVLGRCLMAQPVGRRARTRPGPAGETGKVRRNAER